MRSLDAAQIAARQRAAQGVHARRAAAALLACTCLTGGAAYAQNATWNGSTTDWNTPTNWTPNTVPTGTATFAATGSTSVDNASGLVSIGAIDFNAVAQAYSFTIDNSFLINGAGVANNSANTQAFEVTDGNTLVFQNASTANSGTGAAAYTVDNGGSVTFTSTSNAGNANITNDSGAKLTFNDTSSAGGAVVNNNGGTVDFNNSSTAGSASITNDPGGGIVFADTSTGGNATINNESGATLAFNDTSSAGGAQITNAGTAAFNNSSSAGSAQITNNGGSTLTFNDTSTAGSATITNLASMAFYNSASAGSATITNVGPTGNLTFNHTSTAGSAAITNNSFIVFLDSSTAGSAAITNNNFIVFRNSSTAGSAAITNNASGTVDFSGTSGPAGNNQISAGSIAGAGTFNLGVNQFTVGSNNLSTVVSGTIEGPNGSLVKVGTGTLTLSGADTYTGATTIDAGTLEVDGSIADSSGVTVNSGGTLSGTGTVDPPTTTIMNGGTLAPGNAANPTGPLSIAGDLVFEASSFYGISLTPTQHALTNVSGTTTINGGTVVLSPAGALGTFYGASSFAILSSTGTLSGTFNSNVGYSGAAQLSSTPTLSYVGNNVDLSYGSSVIDLATPAGANQNQRNVINGINNAILAGDSTPSGFQNLLNLSGAALLNAYSQLSGEVATGAEQNAFQLTTEFLNLMLDPFVNGRGNLGGSGAGGNPGLGFAPDQQGSLPPDIALAYDEVFKAPPKQQNFDQRWGAWGSAYGGSNTAAGDPGVGSNNLSAQTYGYAAGMDYHFAPSGVAGFALAGGGTNWGLANGLGSGYSQAFQFGGYGIQRFGPAYLAGALSFTNNWFTTNRTALGDELRANFAGQSYGARVEGGYRYAVLPTLGVTPYGAVQFQDFHTPSYSENDLTGGGFGLSYAAMNATDVRTELGARFDDPTLLYGKPLILFGRLAWAHDFVSDPSLSAVFEALPGSSFTVFGAPIPHDSALTTAGLQYFLAANWQLIAKFDGDFAAGYQTYAGTGTLRYTW